MSKIRIYELAKKLDVSSKVVLNELSKLGIERKTHTSGIEPEIAKTIEDALQKKAAESLKEVLPSPPPVEKPSEGLKEHPVQTIETEPSIEPQKTLVIPEEEKKPVIQLVVPRKKTLKLQEGTTVKEFAELISIKLSDVIKKFMELGYMPTINQSVDPDAALLVAEGFGDRSGRYYSAYRRV